MSESIGKLRLPRLVRATLRHFTLYNLEREIEIEFPDGVFCLAGANGLGKSTFLLAVNYAITGRVAEPDRDFISFEAYYNKTEDFSRYFFEGRIAEGDRERAEVEIQLQVGSEQICLQRGMFEPNTLRGLWVEAADGKLYEEDGTPAELNDRYRTIITTKTGLASFDQLVFLQHFVLTFDERRHLLFWNVRELDRTLHLAFGVDAQMSRRADVLREKAERAYSYGKNASWQASLVRKKLKELEGATAGSGTLGIEDVEVEYNRLQEACDRANTLAEKCEMKLRDANLRLAEVSARQATLRAEYDMAFSNRLATRADICHHPIIRESIAEGRCQLCDSAQQQVAAAIQKRVKSAKCPICGSTIKAPRKTRGLAKLKQLDKQLVLAAKDLGDAVKKVHRLKTDFEEFAGHQETTSKAFDQFTKRHRKEIASLEAKATPGIKAVLDDYRRQIEQLESDKRKGYKERDSYREQLKPLQRQLEKHYRDAEHIFVPLFKDLAESFLGVELNVRFQMSTSAGVGLVLEVEEDERREQHQLSESQRFFVDIALRMALIQYMSDDNHPGCLYLDTPEGSLDIAYETRAGRMIARFVQAGFGCVMTANINTSRLLLTLAEECDAENMELYRMTSWAELTDVQNEEEELFDKAFSQIERNIERKKKK